MTTDKEKEVLELRAKISELEAMFGQRHSPLVVTYKLPPKLAELLTALMALPHLTAEMAEDELALTTDVKVAVHRLRTYMAPFGIKIECRRFVGYWLSAEAKTKVQEHIGPHLPAEVKAA